MVIINASLRVRVCASVPTVLPESRQHGFVHHRDEERAAGVEQGRAEPERRGVIGAVAHGVTVERRADWSEVARDAERFLVRSRWREPVGRFLFERTGKEASGRFPGGLSLKRLHGGSYVFGRFELFSGCSFPGGN